VGSSQKIVLVGERIDMTILEWLVDVVRKRGFISNVEIETLDNPGWGLRVENNKKLLERDVFIDHGDDDWIRYLTKDKSFSGWGDSQKLIGLMEEYFRVTMKKEPKFEKETDLQWLMDWFQSQCNEDWEHGYGVRIRMDQNTECVLSIITLDTDWEIEGEAKGHYEGKQGWYDYRLDQEEFAAKCSGNQLKKMIAEFRRYLESGYQLKFN